MFGKFLTGLILCVAIGSAVGSYVDRGEALIPVLGQGPVATESQAMQSCLERTRTELEVLDPRLGYLERDLRYACEIATETSVASHYRRARSGAPPVKPRSRYN